MNAVSDLALVLTGGGARASYQVGVLQEIAARIPDLPVPIITGVSAGAINASYLAGHCGTFKEATDGLRAQWARLRSENIYNLRTLHLLRSAARWMERIALARSDGTPGVRGLLHTEPLRQFLAECIDFPGIEKNIASGRLRAVALSASSYTTGDICTFVDGAPGVELWERAGRIAVRTRLRIDHVMASSAIPLVFPAVEVDGTFYADGSVRQTFPLSPAIHLGAKKILAIGTRWWGKGRQTPRPPGGYPTVAEALGLMLDAVFMDSLNADAEVLGRLNRFVSERSQAESHPGDLRPVDFLMLRPSRDLENVAAEGLARLPKVMRLVVRGMGGDEGRDTTFLSYLLFDPSYTDPLIELGREDARNQWSKIGAFLGV